MPIGGVTATREVVIPNAVGVDIGCGVCAVRTDLQHIDRARLKEIMRRVRASVPLGFKHHKKPRPADLMPPLNEAAMPVVCREYERARKQLGTLGGGNHFIEIQQGDDGLVWLMVHSGSRNLGHQVAGFYNKEAIRLSEQAKDPVPRSWQLAPLRLDSEAGRSYLAEMSFCVEFALANRTLIMERLKEAVTDAAGPVRFDAPINRSHNFAALETHGGREVLVHRKGAIRALAGEPAPVPGSQGTASYIVSGRGNPASFCSCSHGAGRRLGRRQAVKSLDLDREVRLLDRLGVIHAIRRKKDLDEAPSAYKDIDRVMALQADLVDIRVKLRPLAVIKG
jgi:tRNA-splicing ligase RtcB